MSSGCAIFPIRRYSPESRPIARSGRCASVGSASRNVLLSDFCAGERELYVVCGRRVTPRSCMRGTMLMSGAAFALPESRARPEELSAKERLIVALDFSTAEEAQKIVDKLG